MHSIQSALEVLFQARGALAVRLLWSRVLRAPGATTLRNWDCRPLGCGLLAWLDSHVLSESLNLLQDHLAHLANIFNDLEVEVEGGGAARLVGGVVPDVQVRVFEGSLDGDS